jgi:hypothetical protein
MTHRIIDGIQWNYDAGIAPGESKGNYVPGFVSVITRKAENHAMTTAFALCTNCFVML